jgi:hypothetical protein
MGLDVGGFTDRPDWPKMGPSLLIAACLILAIRTAKWPASVDRDTSHPELDREIHFAANLANCVLSHLIRHNESIFPRRKEPWYQPNDEAVSK